MICYLVRHGQDDDTVRGGWGNSTLTLCGIQQVKKLSDYIRNNNSALKIGKIYSSDLLRAKLTAEIISEENNLPIYYLPEFREVNNGDLAGLNNEIADIKYPNMYWRKLDFEEHYPNGESPKEFYQRVSSAWYDFCNNIKAQDKNTMLVTHGGVIQIILCIENNEKYTNKNNRYSVSHAKLIPIEI